MIKSLKMTCFRKHESTELTFTEGLSLIRGANEKGKTTCIEALLYGLFGSRALRDSFENVVTWGCKPSDLRVEVAFGDYVITRSKAGAEVLSMGQVHVTGQKEVGQFCEELLGCDATTATQLMFANQNALRGVLEAGPKAAAQMVETLSDFDLFDRLLAKIEDKWVVGSTAVQEARLQDMQNAVVEIGPLDTAFYDEKISSGTSKLAELKVQSRQMAEKIDTLTAFYEAEFNKRKAIFHAENSLKEKFARRDTLKGQLQAASQLTEPEDPERYSQQLNIQAEWDQYDEALRRIAALKEPPKDSPFFGVLRVEAEERATHAQSQIDTIKKEVANLERDYAVLETKKINGSVCGYCQKDVTEFPEVAAKNAQIDREMQAIVARFRKKDEALKTLMHDIHEYGRVSEYDRHIRRNEIERDLTMFPATIIPPAPPAHPRPETRLEENNVTHLILRLRKEREDYAKAQGMKEAITSMLHNNQIEIGELDATIKALTAELDPGFEQATRDLSASKGALDDIHNTIRNLEIEIKDWKTGLNAFIKEHMARVAEQERLKTEIERVKSDIAVIQRNTALLKKIKKLRPVVGNKLWALMLGSASHLFSMMRGEKSLIERGDSGFTVNGKPVSSLSGSTIDLLGLAIRIAMIKNFIPHAPFLILDEASAGMDEDRHRLMIGAVAACGFKQVLMITHSDLPESVADALIQL